MSKSQFVGVILFNDNLMLSSKGLQTYSHIHTCSLNMLSVHSFHVEAVSLLVRTNSSVK